MKGAQVHVDYAMKLCQIQSRAGRYYLYEHPRSASSWALPSVQNLAKNSDNLSVEANLCQFGLRTKYKGEEGLVRKATRFYTNSPEIAKRLSKKCSQACRDGQKHLAIWGDRARKAQVYPKGLCAAVADGLRAQKMVMNCQVCEIGSEEILEMAAEDKEERHEDQTSEWAQAWDDVTGQELIASEVQAARAKEMGYVKSMEVYAPATYAECIKNTGKPPIKSRWLDINKGDDANINYRSRWVAKHLRHMMTLRCSVPLHLWTQSDMLCQWPPVKRMGGY